MAGRPYVGPIVFGARTDQQLRESLAVAAMTLTPEQHARIEAVARPAPVYPFWHRALTASERLNPVEAEYVRGYRQTMGLEQK